jgi:hypothetical protein
MIFPYRLAFSRMAGVFVVLVKSLLICWVLMYLAESFGWSLVREAGGSAV